MVLAAKEILETGFLPAHRRDITVEQAVAIRKALSIKGHTGRLEVRVARLLENRRMALLHKLKEYRLKNYGKTEEAYPLWCCSKPGYHA